MYINIRNLRQTSNYYDSVVLISILRVEFYINIKQRPLNKRSFIYTK